MRALLIAGRAFVTPKIRSKTLRAALKTYVVGAGRKGLLNVPHFWSWYFHDGRGPVRTKYSKYLVWYKNPKEDPRLSGGYPVTRSQQRRLQHWEFVRDLNAGKIIMTKTAGPFPKAKANPFFTEGMAGFPAVADKVVRAKLPGYIAAQLRRNGVSGITVKDVF
jgi:hypothetical protein